MLSIRLRENSIGALRHGSGQTVKYPISKLEVIPVVVSRRDCLINLKAVLAKVEASVETNGCKVGRRISARRKGARARVDAVVCDRSGSEPGGFSLKKPVSDIPQNAVEMQVKGSARLTECIVEGRVVGRRVYNEKGRIVRERSLKDGKQHGNEIVWDDDGTLLSVEPYFEGQIHGLAKQYGRSGKVIGTYRFVHGTGYDIWRWEWWEGFAPVSEIHSMRDGVPHGYEWWLEPDQRGVDHERHWCEGKFHSIERRVEPSEEIASRIPQVLDPRRSGYQTSIRQSR